MPVREVAGLDSGTFACAPGTHKRGVMHDPSLPMNKIPDGAIAPEEWRTALFRVHDDTFIRDMNPQPRVPTSEVECIAYVGARVLAGEDRIAGVLRRNRY